ncbi:MAG: GGDEF domain-containing protein [Planctomycetes bacterium]|nr:GGDEF domain-containing protein [Planctomycetota bacterium]
MDNSLPIPVAWIHLPEDGPSPEPVACPELQLVPARADSFVVWRGQLFPEVLAVLLDVRGSAAESPAREVQAVLSSCLPRVLVRAPAERIPDLLPVLRPGEDLCVLEEPPALLVYRVRRLLTVADLDGLTRLPRRQTLLARLDRDLPRVTPQEPLSLLLLDLDHFKRINDEHGHLVGDQVLQHVAGLLPTHEGVFVARFGGEEFAVLLPGADEPSAVAYAERLCAIVRDRPTPGGLAVTVSIGVSTALHPLPGQELISQVDQALYAAKGRGRDRVIHFGALEREVLRAGRNLRIESFETMQRVLTERVTEVVSRRGRRLLEALQNQADRDALTGLFNRGYLDRRMAHDFQEARQLGQPLSMALLDVDFFGQVNKTHGWPTGDLTLRQVADLVREHVRDRDWVARYGGEEIAVILPGASRDAAVLVVERIRQEVGVHTFHNAQGEPFRVTLSAGVVELQSDEDLRGLWQRLSDRLLGAKTAGRNQVRS